MARRPSRLEVTDRVAIPARELALSYAGSSGPGGQHTNRTATKAVLRWNLAASAALDAEAKARVRERLASRLTTGGDLVLTCERHRDQGRNAAEVLDRLARLLRGALARPRPRRPTRPSRGARERRLAEKRRASERKRERRGE